MTSSSFIMTIKTKILTLAFLLTLISTFAQAQSAQSAYVRLITNKGNITLMLYDGTPKHRDNFLKTIREGKFNDAQFNRVIKAFVSQGGDLDDTILNREKLHPEETPKRIPAEINGAYFHKKGALGAGRDDNPQKSSYFTQIYLVTGKTYTDEQMDDLEKKRGIRIPLQHRQIYKKTGGDPQLDGFYTVFGEIVEGMDVADTINNVSTNAQDVPEEAVKFKAVILSKKESAEIFKRTIKTVRPSTP